MSEELIKNDEMMMEGDFLHEFNKKCVLTERMD